MPSSRDNAFAMSAETNIQAAKSNPNRKEQFLNKAEHDARQIEDQVLRKRITDLIRQSR